MADRSLVTHARQVWQHLAAAPVSFVDGSLAVATSPGSLLCPPGWAGIVVVGGAAIATAPDGASADRLRQGCRGVPIAALTDPAALRLTVAATLGPATLAYCDTPPAPGGGVATVPAGDLRPLLASVPADDAGESGLDEITSPAFVVREGARVTAAAGYHRWPAGTAHLSVLTAPDRRGRGLARRVAAAAVAHALATGLTPQWRARPAASRRVARALGFAELGTQLSLRLRAEPPAPG